MHALREGEKIVLNPRKHIDLLDPTKVPQQAPEEMAPAVDTKLAAKGNDSAIVGNNLSVATAAIPSDPEKKKKKVQRHALGETNTEIPRSVESILGSAGHPLDAGTRQALPSGLCPRIWSHWLTSR